jgi:transposase InsO family protein
MILNHVRRFGSPDIIHTDQGPAFHNELVTELLRLCGIEQSFAAAYSSEENGMVDRANQEVLRHLRALLFGSHVQDKWPFEQLPLVQRIMNTVEAGIAGNHITSFMHVDKLHDYLQEHRMRALIPREHK